MKIIEIGAENFPGAAGTVDAASDEQISVKPLKIFLSRIVSGAGGLEFAVRELAQSWENGELPGWNRAPLAIELKIKTDPLTERTCLWTAEGRSVLMAADFVSYRFEIEFDTGSLAQLPAAATARATAATSPAGTKSALQIDFQVTTEKLIRRGSLIETGENVETLLAPTAQICFQRQKSKLKIEITPPEIEFPQQVKAVMADCLNRRGLIFSGSCFLACYNDVWTVEALNDYFR